MHFHMSLELPAAIQTAIRQLHELSAVLMRYPTRDQSGLAVRIRDVARARPHSSLWNLTPSEFALELVFACQANLCRGLRRRTEGFIVVPARSWFARLVGARSFSSRNTAGPDVCCINGDRLDSHKAIDPAPPDTERASTAATDNAADGWANDVRRELVHEAAKAGSETAIHLLQTR